IVESGAEVLVTSCPICAREFASSYHLTIPVLHHSQYLLQLTKQNRLRFNQSGLKVTYHDPCELSRGLNITREPRELLQNAAILSNGSKEIESKSLCCGGSLGITNISMTDRYKIANNTLDEIVTESSSYLVTACPMCRKTFTNAQEKIKVLDIAEILEKNLNFAPEKASDKVQTQAKHQAVTT
ncbi:MAG: (Fe-S)-binding protein, partial [Bacteroidales bacterium]|nr:(Fe-S)-binding protein [Bacteroidales bacterium]